MSFSEFNAPLVGVVIRRWLGLFKNLTFTVTPSFLLFYRNSFLLCLIYIEDYYIKRINDEFISMLRNLYKKN